MMIVPRRNDFDLLDEMFKDTFFDRKESRLMKTDIKEDENNYSLVIDLPGYEKRDIKINVENDYLIVKATKNKEEKEEEGKYLRQERYYGECTRSFYVGPSLETEDIKANFKNGVLTLVVPKKEERKEIPEKKYVEIED